MLATSAFDNRSELNELISSSSKVVGNETLGIVITEGIEEGIFGIVTLAGSDEGIFGIVTVASTDERVFGIVTLVGSDERLFGIGMLDGIFRTVGIEDGIFGMVRFVGIEEGIIGIVTLVGTTRGMLVAGIVTGIVTLVGTTRGMLVAGIVTGIVVAGIVVEGTRGKVAADGVTTPFALVWSIGANQAVKTMARKRTVGARRTNRPWYPCRRSFTTSYYLNMAPEWCLKTNI